MQSQWDPWSNAAASYAAQQQAMGFPNASVVGAPTTNVQAAYDPMQQASILERVSIHQTSCYYEHTYTNRKRENETKFLRCADDAPAVECARTSTAVATAAAMAAVAATIPAVAVAVRGKGIIK